MAAPQASSRLELLQARFQQKQLQEKEQKLLQLYDQQQQRAYQVVQRGSAGSNSSNATSIGQHTVTKTSSSSHTTSTSQGGKVRQMFDERRQTTVKGIDRSYPLEPLENKPRKQTNGNGVQKNGVLTVNRQSVTVKRMARADVNSNLNGGKPVVSYHEEITRESFGPSAREQQDEDEFGNENRVAQYANGNHRGETHIEEILDEDTIERNRMMAKLHLMEYDETLKHRVKNDLESEEFPEGLMVDVPDKLPKQSVTKKLSQAEVRLERFKNANAKRSNSVTKNLTAVPKKRSEPILPAKSTYREDRTMTKREVSNRGSRDGGKSPGSGRIKVKTRGKTEETISSLDSERNRGHDGPRFFCEETERSATTYAIDSKNPSKLSIETLAERTRRDAGPAVYSGESDRSSTVARMERVREASEPREDVKRPGEGPKFFCGESERSDTTYAIDATTAKTMSAEPVRDISGRNVSPRLFREKLFVNTAKRFTPESERIVEKKSKSPKFFCRETGKSATTCTVDSKTVKRFSPEVTNAGKTRSQSPRFFCRESDKSATTYSIDSKTIQKLSSESLKDRKPRSQSPKFFCRESEKSATTYAIDSRNRAASPGFTTNVKPTMIEVDSRDTINESISSIDTVDRYIKSKPETISRTPSPGILKSSAKLEHPEETKVASNKLLNVYERLSSSAQFFSRKDKKPATTKTIDPKHSKCPSESSDVKNRNIKKRGTSASVPSSKRHTLTSREFKATSPEFPRRSYRKSNTSPQFYVSDSERSASVLTVRPETISKPRTTSPHVRTREQSPASFEPKTRVSNVIRKPERPVSEDLRDDTSKEFIRSSVSQFFSERCEKALRDGIVEARSDVRSTETGKKPHLSRGSSPLSLRDMRTPTPTRPELPHGGASIDRRSNARDSSTNSREIVKGGEQSPEFFCYEAEKSATTIGMKPRPRETLANQRARSRPKSMDFNEKFGRESLGKSTRDQESFDSATISEDSGISSRGGSGNVLRSTKLIRDAIKRQSHENRADYGALKHRKGSRNSGTASPDASGMSNESRRGSKEERVEVDGKVERRPGTPEASQLEFSPKSSISAEVDAKIQEIAMSDQRVKQKQLRGTYSRSSNETSNVEKLFTYSVRKPTRKRGSLLESSVFEPSTRDEEVELGSKCITPDSLTNLTVTIETVDEGLVSGNQRPDQAKGDKINLEETIIHNLKSTEYRKRNSDPSPTNEPKVGVLKRRSGKHFVNGRAEGKVVKSAKQSPGQTKKDKVNLKETATGKTRSRKDSTFKNSSPTNKLIIADSRHKVIKDTLNRRSQVKVPVSREQTPSPLARKSAGSSLKKIEDDSRKRRTPSPRVSRQTEILRSMELVRRAMKGSNVDELRGTSCGILPTEQIKISGSTSSPSTTIELSKPSRSLVHAKEETSADKHYERTDSVESALRRFDSIGAESVRSTVGRSRDSITEQRLSEQRTVCLRALDRPNVNLLRETPDSGPPSRRSSRRSSCSVESEEGKKTQRQKRLAKSRDSTEIARLAVNAKSTTCKRKLFQDADSGEETESGSAKSRRSHDSLERGPAIGANKNETADSVCSVSTQFEYTSGYVSAVTDKTDKTEGEATSTGLDRSSLSVKQLRSIEDIRKSIEKESTEPRSAIAGNSTGRVNVDDRVANRIPLAGRSASGDANRPSTVKCTMRFFRVAKSPSPEAMTKMRETGGRARRNVPASPSQSPDTVARRPSTESKGQDTKSTKRPTPLKSTEPIGNRKATTTTTTTTTTTMTSTTTRKSTDVVDGAILENGLHLRGQTAETKYENESTTAKKSDAFVIDLDEQPPKENDAPLPRKSLLRKQSTEKQIPSTQSTRPPSSVSSTSSGSFMQSQTSGSRGKMASRVKTPVSNKSSSSKNGGNATCVEHLVPCKICGRRFAQDRVGLHEQICAKTGEKKRKQFDTVMYRVRGTDLEPFVKKGLACKTKPEKLKKPEIKSNWRRKHEDFITAIRAAKQVQAHLAAGGKLSDLPPPPVSDNCDYIQCPHCGRRFNQAAAERHIPKCEHMLHNKPVHMRVPKPRR